MASSTQQRDLTSGTILGQLVRMTVPMVWGIVAVMSIGLIDTYFVGQLGTQALAALGFVFPVMLTLTSLAIGLGAGAASVISRVIGAGDQHQVKRLTTDALCLGLAVVMLASGLGMLTIEPLFLLLGASQGLIPLISSYMMVWYPSMVLLVIPMLANSIIRANGDSFYPSVIMIIAAVINGILDPLLIQGLWLFPELGFAGAAWASVGARSLTLLASLLILMYRERMLSYSLPSAASLLSSWASIARIGIPAAGGNMVNPVGVAIITAAIALIGQEQVAGFNVASRMQAFAVIPMLALSASIGPVVGQNWGADLKHRSAQALKASFIFSLLWSLLLAVLFWLFAAPLAGLFSSDQQVITIACQYLHIVPFSLVGYGCVIIAAAAFNAIDRPIPALVYNLHRTFIWLAPLAWLAAALSTVEAVFWSVVLANIVGGAAAVAHAWHFFRKHIE
ncbi:MATE family efflux transporter [Alteromonas gilva]|uniref:MATE family efflux transporter n=1 Tax=Alteromonas gilva TaxID=2987522 RepID=A0ABT5L1A2_9ALTE|nr:MATE family efflux transporter [Alteromonas gilva]MDC8830246.1 MATE family efflux transporter [Alteromonas gilva]